MGDPEGRQGLISLLAERVDSIENRALTLGVQQGGGFVKQQKTGIACESSCDGQSLFLAATEGMNRPRRQTVQSQLIEQVVDAADSIVVCGGVCKAEQQVRAATWKQQLVIGVLKHHGHPVRGADRAALRLDQAGDQSKQRAFATAVAADQHPETWFWDGQVAVPQGLVAVRPAVAELLEVEFSTCPNIPALIRNQRKSQAVCCRPLLKLFHKAEQPGPHRSEP